MSYVTLGLNACFDTRSSRAAGHLAAPPDQPDPRPGPAAPPAAPRARGVGARAAVATCVTAGALLALPAGAAAQDTDPAGADTDTVTRSDGDNDGATAAGEDDVSAQWWYGANLSVAPGSVSENGGSQTVTVTAEVSEWGTSTNDLTYVVTVGKGGDSAVAGTDYQAVSTFPIVIKSGRRSGSNSFNLTPIADTAWEGDETITIHASGTDGAQSTTLTLTDEGDRPYSGPQVTLSANPATVSEADGATTVTVTAASAAHSASRKVTVSVGAGGTATSGTDYAAVSNFDITLAANATSATGTFTLTPTQDTAAEGNETIALAGQVEGSTTKLTGTTLTLTDDDAAPDITLSASPSSVTENGGAKTVTVTATSTAAANARTVLVAVGNRQDTATPGTDYTVVPAFNITLAANATSATGTFTLTPTNDTSVEATESISIDGTPESGGAAFTVSGTALTLTDDDAMPAVTLTATPSSVDEAALATAVTVKATAASAVAWARTVTVSVGATGLAASGTDYAAVSNFDVTIAANALSGTGTFTLKPIQDTTNEGNETIGVAGSSLNTTVTGATVTIADDDVNPAVTLSASPSSVTEGATAVIVTVTATAASPITTERTVTVSVGSTGTATSGTDYAAVSNFDIVIAANATSGTGTFTLTTTQDTAVEGGETIGVTGTSTSTTVTGTTVALTDDDTWPAITLSTSTSSVSEGASATSVTVTATAASSIASGRTVTVSVGQTGTAAPGSDYAAVTDFTITIAANATSGTGTFTLTPTQDTLVEDSKTIGVDGSSPNTTVTNATITLTDDDKDVVTLSVNRPSVGEESSAVSVTVTATATTALSAARTVTVSVGDTGTATSGTDYAAVSDFDITIAANATSGTGTFTLTPTSDSTNEGNETIGIAGTNSVSTVTGTTLTLVDYDQPLITLSADKSGVGENGTHSVSITATRPSNSTAAAGNVTISVGLPTDSATKGTDYEEVADFTITIPAGQTSASGSFSISVILDDVSDHSEGITIWGTSTGYRVSGTSMSTVEWSASMWLTTDVSSVNETDGATTVTVTVNSTQAMNGSTWVDVSIGGGGSTATSGTDFAAVSSFRLRYPYNPRQKTVSGTFTLTPTQDALLESDETIWVNGAGPYWNAYSGRGTEITLTDAQPIALSVHPSSVSEGAPATQVAVSATATGTVSTPRTVTVSVGDTGTATSGTDYAAVSDFDIVIPANRTGATNTFTLTPTKDSAGEGDETIGISGSSTTAYVYPTTLTLADTNPAVTLTATPSSIREGAGATSVTVTATAASAIATARTVTVAVGDTGTATSGTDYAAVSDFTITIAANKTSGTGTFTLTPTDDTTLEGNETIGVAGTSSEAATISGTTVTLTDDDLPTIALATVPANVTVAESAGLTPVTVRATAAAAMKAETTVTLTVGAGGDSATKTTDYTTSNVRYITIPKGQSTAEASFELTPKQDTLVEGDEKVSVSGSSDQGHTVTGTSLKLSDDDGHPAITLSANPSSVAESASGTSVTVTATAASAIASARTVSVKVGGSGTATSGTDYAAVSDFTITIAASATSGTGTFTLTPTQDTTVEGDETIGVAGTSTLSVVTGTTVTLTDDDSHPAITLSANPSSVSEGASATSVTVTATAVSAIAAARTVTVAVGGSGTASRGTDYATVADFTITITANATTGTGTFTLTPTQDTVVEGSETIGVAGTSPSSTVTGTTVTITDDDSHAITLSANPSTVAEDKASETVTVTATLNVARSTATTVSVSVGDSADEATSGTDYKAVSDFNVTIAANQTSGTGTFTFEPKSDTAYEGFENVSISGTTQSGGGGVNAFGANALNANVSTGIPVTDTSLSIHDASNYPAVTLSVSPSSVGEGAGATSVTVTATAASAIGSSREVTVAVGGTGTATSGTDYTAVSDFIIKIDANQTSGTGTFTLTPTNDSVVEPSETIGVAGTSLSTTVTGTTVTLTDNDSAEVTVNDANAAEGGDMTFTVTLDTAVVGGLTVTPGYTNGTASSSDYTANTAALSFTGTAGETQTFTVSTTQDTVVEGDETFTVGLTVSGTTLTGSITATDTGTGTINSGTESSVDTATLTLNDASAAEGEGMTFTVTLSEAVQGGLTVTPSYTNGTAASGDYTANTTALSFTGTKGETKTFTVSTTEDAVLEANETFTVSMSVSGTTLGSRITATDTGAGTINDDDSTTVTVNDASASEGESMTFTVTLSEAVQGGLKVTPSYTNGTAASGDYTANTTALTFSGTKGETETFTVSTTEDAVLEGNETFTVGLSVSGTSLGVTATDTGTGTINDDESAAAVTVSDANADEGNSMTFTVTLDKAVQGGLKVTPGYTDGTASSSTDYTRNTAALTFTGTANETKTFTVSTTEDAVVEGKETFTVGLSVSGTSLSVTATDTGAGTINNDDGAVVTVNNASASEGDDMTFTVTLGAAVQGGLTVTPSFTDVTAVEGTDYDKNTAALSFTGTANETKTFTVSTTEDAVLEANETFTVGLSSSNSSVTSTDTGTGTINNDDSAAVTINDASADEGDSMTFTVTLDKAVQGGLTVTPGYADGTASSADYTRNTAALSFSGTADETRSFTVSTTEDAVLEGAETFTVSLNVSGTSLGVTATDTGAGTINNDDGATVTVNDASAEEGDSMTFTVTLGGAVQGGLTVTPGYTDGTASSDDYTRNTAALSFSGTKGETKTFTVATTEDDLFEGNETFTVGLSTSNSDVTSTDTGTGTINTDDGKPDVSLSLTPSSVGEGDGATHVTVTAAFSNRTTYEAAQKVTVSVGGSGTATSGTDYAAVSSFAVTIPAGQTSGTANFTLTPTNDTLVEGNESVGVAGSATDLTVNGATLTLTDDDGRPSVSLSLSPATVGETDEATTVRVTAEFSNTNTYATDQTVSVSVGGSGTATSGTDYAAVSDFDLTISAGRTDGAATFTLTPTEDTLVEGNETIGVAGSATGLTVYGATLTLLDVKKLNEDDATVNLSVSPATLGEGDGATTVAVTAALSTGATFAADQTVTVTVGGSGTATSGTDYAAVSSFAVTIPAGQTSGTATFTLTPTDDTLVESSETVGVAGSAADLTVNGTELTLNDNDGAPTVKLSAAPATVGEGDGATTVAVTAAFSTGATFAADTTVTVAVGGSGTATSGTDYAAVSDFDVTIAAGQTSGTANFTLKPTDDSEVEGNETIGLAGSATDLTVNGAELTLTDNDGAPTVNLSAAPATVGEGDGATTVAVTAAFSTGATFATDTTVTVAVGGSGTAASGTDYAAVADFDVTIAAGQTSGTANFTLTPTDDSEVEGNETIGLAGSATDLTVNGTELTLTDNDGAPTVNLSAAPATLGEGDGATTVAVTAAFSTGATFAADTTVTVTVGGSGTAASGTDYAAVADFDVTIAAGQTSGTANFTLTPTDDSEVEGNETVGLAGSATDLTVNGTELTLTDNDGAPTVNLSAAPATLGEGDGATTVAVTAAFSTGATFAADTTVTVAVGGSGTAASGTDYAAVADFDVTIAAGQTSGTANFTLTPTDDSLVEGNETIGLAGSAADLTVNGTELTLTDNDGAPTVNLSAAPATVGEGDGATTVAVTAAFSTGATFAADTTVTVAVGGSGTAASGTDYAAVSDFDVTIAAGQTSGTANFTLTPTDDTLVEGNETVGVAGSATDLTVNGTELTLTDNDGAPTVNLSAAPATVGEGDGATTVAVTAAFSTDATFAADTTVTVAVGGSGTAASGTDYAAVADFDVTISAGQTSGTANFTLTPTDDTLVEGNETVGLAGSAADLTVNGAALTLTDNDGAPIVNLSAAPATLGEGDGATTVAVTAAFSTGATFAADTTVTVAVGGSGTATSGTDYAAVADFDVTISSGQTSGTANFTLTPTDDSEVEGNETIGLAGSAADLTVNGTALTLTDNDQTSPADDDATPTTDDDTTDDDPTSTTDDDASNDDTSNDDTSNDGTSNDDTSNEETAAPLTLTVTGAQSTEGGTVVFTVALSAASTETVNVQYATSDGTAQAGADYTAASGQLAFAPGTTEATVTVPVTDDADVENDETFALAAQVVSGSAGASGTGASGAGTILDNDLSSVSVSAPAVRETAGVAAFTVLLSRPSPRPVDVTYETLDGTAQAGADYAATAGRLTFAPGQTEATVSVPVMDDAALENVETFLMTLEATDRDKPLPTADGEASIHDDDVPATRSQATSRTLYLLARSMASEAVAAIGERFVGTGNGQAQMALGAVPMQPMSPFGGAGMAPGAGGLGHAPAWGAGGPAGLGGRGMMPGMMPGPGVGGAAGGAYGAAGGGFGAAGGMGLMHGGGPGTPLSDEPFAELAWLDGANFAMPVVAAEEDEDGGASWTVWGRAGTVRSSMLAESGESTRGDVFTSHVGIETRLRAPVLVGVAVSHSVGSLGYTLGSPVTAGSVPGEGEGDMTSVQPYVHWAPRAGLTVWGMGGMGRGSLTGTDAFGTFETPLGLRLFAGGGRQELTVGGGLALKADVFHARLRSDEQAELAEATGTARRFRVLAESRTDWTVSESAAVSPRVEAGLRWDGGSDVEGLGAELGGGLAYVNTRLNIGLETHGRYLLAHQAAGFEEWGAGVTLRVGPGVDGSGPWLALEPQWGAAMSGVHALWDPRAAPEMHRGAERTAGAGPDRVALTTGYRLSEANSVSVEAVQESRQGAQGVALRALGNLSWGAAGRPTLPAAPAVPAANDAGKPVDAPDAAAPQPAPGNRSIGVGVGATVGPAPADQVE